MKKAQPSQFLTGCGVMSGDAPHLRMLNFTVTAPDARRRNGGPHAQLDLTPIGLSRLEAGCRRATLARRAAAAEIGQILRQAETISAWATGRGIPPADRTGAARR